tara:strand:- start:667 stop:2292 length:1626 start_codon:yes stop_codon:yes gene_type:complete
MGLIFTSLIYSLVLFILTIKELITDKYDHDIDQFMYFGSRILNNELIWTKEFDDKSPVVQYIFSLPAAFKSTNIFVLITLIVSAIGIYLGYSMLKDMLENSELKLNKREEKSILYFGTILYFALIICIYGSLHHINAISSSLCLITISLTYLNKRQDNKLITNVSALTSAISISIRPYYLLNIILIPMWLSIRERKIIIKEQSKNIFRIYSEYIKNQINWIIIITLYIILLNLTPYLLSGHLSDFIYGIKLNSTDYINHNIFQRQYINIGRNPILYPITLGIIILPLSRILFRKIIYNYYKNKENGLIHLYKLDTDLIFFGIINPILLEIMFYRKHFFGHYFTLFSPYILISAVLLLALIMRLNKIISINKILKITIKSIFIMLLIICLITNQSLPNAINEITNKQTSNKSYKVQIIKEFLDQERSNEGSLSFLAPENNYIHWKLDESRHGFPQKAVYRNIFKGKMDNIITNHKKLNYKFLLPTKSKLCETLNTNAPKYIITENNDFSFNCLKQKSSKYKLLSATQKLNKNNIFIFKRFQE